jgi:plastocyanin
VGWVALDPAKARAAVARGQVRGAARFEGAPPAMPVPAERAGAPFCKGKPVPLEEIVVQEGMLRDVLVQLKGVALRGAAAPPRERAVVRQVDCMYRPRVTGVVAGEELQIDNGDPTLHNVHSYQDRATLWNLAQAKGGAPIVRAMDTLGVAQLRCDVHPWMKAFVVVTDHPFFAVTGDDGRFSIDHVPAGRYAIEAWHPRLGQKRASVVVSEAGAEATFVYRPEDDTPEDDAPPE